MHRSYKKAPRSLEPWNPQAAIWSLPLQIRCCIIYGGADMREQRSELEGPGPRENAESIG